MNTFDDRKKAFENKFVQDADLQFRLKAKRNKLIGEWAAERLKKDNKEDYVKEVRESDLEKPGDEDIIEKILDDFKKAEYSLSREELLLKFSEFENKAKEDLISAENF
tara:strand:- start:148 stop:471 length:324 start_codon:yes stop_codon:yes gene_type:complete